jgi:putative transposase
LARTQSIDVAGVLKQEFSNDLIETLARDTGFLKRNRKIRVVAFFWTLVLGFSAGKTRTIAGLRRMYELATGQTLAPSAFFGRFSPALVQLLKACVDLSLAQFRLLSSLPETLAADLRDVFVADSTVFKLHDALRPSYRGSRRKNTPAAAKLHGIFSVTGKGKSTIALSGENVADVRNLVVGEWVRGALLLFDRGYFCYALLTRIKQLGGAFISPLKMKANPRIVRFFLPPKNVALKEGTHMHNVPKLLRGETFDAEVEIEFYPKHKRGQGRSRIVKERFRVVGIHNPDSQKDHFYMTSLLPAQLPPNAVQAMYRARWEIELLFKELKSGYRLNQISSSKKEISEALIYAALVTLLASRRLLRAFAAGPKGRCVNATRWWRVFVSYAAQILLLVTRSPALVKGSSATLSRTLEHELDDPHKCRRATLLRAALIALQTYPRRTQRSSRKGVRVLN